VEIFDWGFAAAGGFAVCASTSGEAIDIAIAMRLVHVMRFRIRQLPALESAPSLSQEFTRLPPRSQIPVLFSVRDDLHQAQERSAVLGAMSGSSDLVSGLQC